MSTIREAKIWVIVEQLKCHERNGTIGSLEYLKLLEKYKKITGLDWGGDNGN